jgi:hypothetical protein
LNRQVARKLKRQAAKTAEESQQEQEITATPVTGDW